MKTFMSLALFMLGLLCIILGLIIIIKDRLIARVSLMTFKTEAGKKKEEWFTNLLNAFANLVEKIEKLLSKFCRKERLPLALILIGMAMCGFGVWIAYKA